MLPRRAEATVSLECLFVPPLNLRDLADEAAGLRGSLGRGPSRHPPELHPHLGSMAAAHQPTTIRRHTSQARPLYPPLVQSDLVEQGSLAAPDLDLATGLNLQRGAVAADAEGLGGGEQVTRRI